MGCRSTTADYATIQARAIRDNFGADWGIAESGAAGGSDASDGGRVRTQLRRDRRTGRDPEVTQTTETNSDDRMANMLEFTRRALEFMESTMA